LLGRKEAEERFTLAIEEEEGVAREPLPWALVAAGGGGETFGIS